MHFLISMFETKQWDKGFFCCFLFHLYFHVWNTSWENIYFFIMSEKKSRQSSLITSEQNRSILCSMHGDVKKFPGRKKWLVLVDMMKVKHFSLVWSEWVLQHSCNKEASQKKILLLKTFCFGFINNNNKDFTHGK